MTPNNLIEKLNWRYAVKNFDQNKKIDAETWSKIEESFILTPSSYGLQMWKFIVVNDSELRKTLRKHSWNQAQVEEASHFVVFTARTEAKENDVNDFIQLTHEVRGTPLEKLEGYRNLILNDVVFGPRSKSSGEWAARQSYIAVGQAMLAAATIGVDTCPLEGINPVEYDKALNLEGTGYKTLCAVAFGYRDPSDKYAEAPKVRYSKNKIIEYR